MKITKFEEIIAWQKSQDLAVDIYSLFSNLKDFGFKDQIQRASVSISNNIAEGFDRMSDKEFVRFLYIALASNSEVKSMLYLAAKLLYVEKEISTKFISNSEEISKIIRGLIKSIEK
jgi:four helix bundle protein